MIYKNIKQYFFLLIMISISNFFFTYPPKNKFFNDIKNPKNKFFNNQFNTTKEYFKKRKKKITKHIDTKKTLGKLWNGQQNQPTVNLEEFKHNQKQIVKLTFYTLEITIILFLIIFHILKNKNPKQYKLEIIQDSAINFQQDQKKIINIQTPNNIDVIETKPLKNPFYIAEQKNLNIYQKQYEISKSDDFFEMILKKIKIYNKPEGKKESIEIIFNIYESFSNNYIFHLKKILDDLKDQNITSLSMQPREIEFFHILKKEIDKIEDPKSTSDNIKLLFDTDDLQGELTNHDVSETIKIFLINIFEKCNVNLSKKCQQSITNQLLLSKKSLEPCAEIKEIEGKNKIILNKKNFLNTNINMYNLFQKINRPMTQIKQIFDKYVIDNQLKNDFLNFKQDDLTILSDKQKSFFETIEKQQSELLINLIKNLKDYLKETLKMQKFNYLIDYNFYFNNIPELNKKNKREKTQTILTNQKDKINNLNKILKILKKINIEQQNNLIKNIIFLNILSMN